MTTQLNRRIMRVVYAVWFFRTLTKPALLKCYAIAILLWQLFYYISFGNVFVNAFRLPDISSAWTFFAYAVMHTELATLLLLSGLGAFTVWAMRDIIRVLAGVRHQTHIAQ